MGKEVTIVHLNRWMSVADPIHGIIQFDRENTSHCLLLDVVNSQPFQRLRRIKQMGMAEFVFPNATHSRFVHSIGATHLMIQAINHLNQMENAAEHLKSHYPGTTIPMEWLLLLGVLIHDIGHGALSHTLEDILDLKQQGLHHDSYWNLKIMMEDPELLAIWKKYDPQLPEALAGFLGLKGDRHFLSTLISSQLDMDRLDYLQRDSHFLGVKYGQIEDERIINNLLIMDNASGPVIAVRQEAVPAVEHYLFGRHQAYKMALHSLDKASEVSLKMTIKRFFYARQNNIDTGHPAEELYQLMADGAGLSIKDYLRMDDYYLWESIGYWSRNENDPLLQTLALRLMKHEIFKFIDLRGYGFKGSLKDIPAVYEKLQAHYKTNALSWEFGFEEFEVHPKPLYQKSPLKRPIWIATRNHLVDLADISTLPLHSESTQGTKHLIFIWDRPTRQFLRELLNDHFGIAPKEEPVEAELVDEFTATL